jgi:hypothetical protein
VSLQIAVIDSGIDRSHRWLNGVAGGVGFEYEDGEFRLVPGSFDDLYGHGTSIASLIHAFCPQAELVAVRVVTCLRPETWAPALDLDPTDWSPLLEVNVPETQVAQAVLWCIEQDIPIINLSYSVKESEVRDGGPLTEACRRAYERGITIIGSYPNGDDASSYPAAFPTVIGVRRSRELPAGRVGILSETNRDVSAWGGPVHLAFLKNTVSYCFGTSLSCAHVTAIVGRIHHAAGQIGPDRVFDYLKRIS